MLLSEKIAITPFARILPPFALGIVAFKYVSAPDWFVGLCAVAVYAAAWRLRATKQGQWYLFSALFLSGILVASLHATQETMPRGEQLVLVAETDLTPQIQGRWQKTTARAGWFRSCNSVGQWAQTDERIELYIDTTGPIRQGEQLALTGILNPVDTAASRYGALMRSRGISARIYVGSAGLIARLDGAERKATRAAASLQAWAVERLGRLGVNDADRNMLSALVAGERRGMDKELKAAYARTGVSHILSVSGLHTGFVLIFINLLLGWVVLLRRGHIVKNILAILALWVYAVMAGLSPSVVRSALMLSAAQAALGFSVAGGGYNIVLGTATLMLAVRPFQLFDASFQLSFLAVLSILFFYPRLYRKKLNRNRITDTLLSSLLIGVAAQIGTLPLVAYQFGNIPLSAVLINPVVILTAFGTICTGLLWLLLPLPWLDPLCSGVVGGLLWVQNHTVEWAASLPFAAIGPVHSNGWQTTFAYLLLGALAVWLCLREESRRERFLRGKPSGEVAH